MCSIFSDAPTSPPVDGSVLPMEGHDAQADETHSADNPLTALSYHTPTESKPSSSAPQAAFTGLLDGGGLEGGIYGTYEWDDYEPADGATWDDWDDYSPGDAGSYWSDYSSI